MIQNFGIFEGTNVFEYLFERDDSFQVVKLLLQYGISPNICSRLGTSPLHHASYKGDYKSLKLLLMNGGNANIKDFYKETPLYNVVYNMENFQSKIKCAQLLLQYDCDYSITNYDGLTAKQLAHQKGNYEFVKLNNNMKKFQSKNQLIYKIIVSLYRETMNLNTIKKLPLSLR